MRRGNERLKLCRVQAEGNRVDAAKHGRQAVYLLTALLKRGDERAGDADYAAPSFTKSSPRSMNGINALLSQLLIITAQDTAQYDIMISAAFEYVISQYSLKNISRFLTHSLGRDIVIQKAYFNTVHAQFLKGILGY